MKGGETLKVIRLKIPDAWTRYFAEEHGSLRKLCQGFLNDALRSILEQPKVEKAETTFEPSQEV